MVELAVAHFEALDLDVAFAVQRTLQGYHVTVRRFSQGERFHGLG
jgi:hypothetical protein